MPSGIFDFYADFCLFSSGEFFKNQEADDFFAIVYIHEKFINATQVMTLIMINYVLNNSQLEARAPILSADAICTYNFSECIGNF